MTQKQTGQQPSYFDRGTKLLDLAKAYEDRQGGVIVAAKINNELYDLNAVVDPDGEEVEFIDLSSEDGLRIYRRSLYFVMSKAVHKLFLGCYLKVEHSLSSGVYCEVAGVASLTEEQITAIEAAMRDIINRNVPFIKKTVPLREAIKLLMKDKQFDAVKLLRNNPLDPVDLYKLGEVHDFFNGLLVPSAGYLKVFKLLPYLNGFVLISPDKTDPKSLAEFTDLKKLSFTYSSSKEFVKSLDVEDIVALNEKIDSGAIDELIAVTEANHEKKLSQIADQIAAHKDRLRLILIAGPSSSGKTTFAQRLGVQLRVNGIRPVTISLDDYFVDREATPKDEAGNYDFESIYAIDLQLFNQNLIQLINGEVAEVPKFNFVTGSREPEGTPVRLDPDQVLVIEGIHGLNEMLSQAVPKENKFKIFVSALTHMNIDHHNRIRATDIRELRRIVRDFQFRGNSAVRTIDLWPSVRRGEEVNIFPFQEEADTMFNTGLVYELAALKPLAEPLLQAITPDMAQYTEAQRLLKILAFVKPISPDVVPTNSILREFVGGSCFYR